MHARVFSTYCVEFLSVSEGSSSAHNLKVHDVREPLYDETSLSNAHYSQTTSSDTPAENAYDLATSSAMVDEGYPYETPVPLRINDGGNQS